MAPKRPTGPPMNLANMRQNGVRAMIATWEACGHKADVKVDALPDALGVPLVADRMQLHEVRGEAGKHPARVAHCVGTKRRCHIRPMRAASTR